MFWPSSHAINMDDVVVGNFVKKQKEEKVQLSSGKLEFEQNQMYADLAT